MTVVVGTAGHIDHGKTTLLRALTGIDADRLPEERRRGMTIDVGYAHLALGDGTVIDFVDVPGHDKLVGNMLVGAGEIDAAMLVVAADDGPRAQTLEHLALLDALGVRPGLAVVTKIDAVEPERVVTVVGAVTDLLASTSLADSPVLAASGVTGEGLDAVHAALGTLCGATEPPTDRPSLPAGPLPAAWPDMRASVMAVRASRPATLAIDRVFAVKGRGAVVTGTLRGGPLIRGDILRLVPGDRDVRIREIQVHGAPVERVDGGGRTAVNLAGIGVDELHRGDVLTADPAVRVTDRALVTLRGPIVDRARARLHAGTAAVDVEVGRAGRDAVDLVDGTLAGIVRLATPIALAPRDRFVLRRGPGREPIGGVILDVAPARGISRRRQTPERVSRLAQAVGVDATVARLDLHGVLGTELADDTATAGVAAAISIVAPQASFAAVRTAVARTLRRSATLQRDEAATAASALIDRLVADGQLVRNGDRLRMPGLLASIPEPAFAAEMDRLEAMLAVVAPPSLAVAARGAGCPPEGIRALEQAGRIIILEPDLAYAILTYRDLVARALAMAAREPLTPAAYRDATGTSRKYVLAILEDLDRRAILRRTPAGHVPGSKAPATTR